MTGNQPIPEYAFNIILIEVRNVENARCLTPIPYHDLNWFIYTLKMINFSKNLYLSEAELQFWKYISVYWLKSRELYLYLLKQEGARERKCRTDTSITMKDKVKYVSVIWFRSHNVYFSCDCFSKTSNIFLWCTDC